MKVLAYGEILWDIINGESFIGGAPFNFAAHVVKNKGVAAICSAVGDDELGKQAIAEAKRLGVDTSLIQIHQQRPTGTVDVFLNDGQPDYTIHEGVAFDDIILQDPTVLENLDYDVFYFGSLAQREVRSRITLEYILDRFQFRHVFYDINIRKNFYSPSIIRRSLEKATIFKINDQESKIVSELFYGSDLGLEKFSKRIADDFEVELVIVTAAEKGCYILSGGSFHHVPAVPVIVADAVGAGDAFSAAFVCKILSGSDHLSAARYANAVGAFVASQSGAVPGYTEEISF